MYKIDVTKIKTEISYTEIKEGSYAWVASIYVAYPGSDFSRLAFFTQGNSYNDLATKVSLEMDKFQIVENEFLVKGEK